MLTAKNLLQNADPLRHEPRLRQAQRDRLRHRVVSAPVTDASGTLSPWHRRLTPFLATALLIAAVAVATQVWPRGGTALQAAVRFEVRLAEDREGPGLRAARVGASERTVYLHETILVDNSDIAGSRVVMGTDPSRFGVEVRLTAAGAEKMRAATFAHIGRPVAILIDREVVIAPTLRAPLATAALISGDFTRADADRIVNGIAVP